MQITKIEQSQESIRRMTKAELEKEAEEYVHTKHCEKCSTGHCEKKCILVEDDYKTFKDGAEPREKRIAELEAQNKILERRIIRAKECMKKLLFIINSDPSNYNCKGLMQDAEDFIHNRTCNIRKSGQHCITEEPCIMCDN